MRLPFLLAVAAMLVLPAYGQSDGDTLSSPPQHGPAIGMVWAAPEQIDRSLRDLVAMRRMGVEAVRSDLIYNGEILTLADTLGIELYVDLPLSGLPAARLRDTLDYARAVLDTLLGLAQIHPSIRHVGIAEHVDVTDSTACDVLSQLSAHVRREGPSGMRTYYTTRFGSSDRCGGAVDLVLLDLLDQENPIAALRDRGSEAGVGVGAMGQWVRSDTLTGLAVDGSPEAQARYFERYLPILLSDTLSAAPAVVFIYRWRDVRLSYPDAAHDLVDPFLYRYGLHTHAGVERPAFDVVRGILTGRQTTFAFRRGDAAAGGAPWISLFGWGVLVLMGTFYALSPRFRHMVPRYFGARFFYRDAVREGRDVLFGASTVLLVALSAAFGLTLSVLLDVLRRTDAFTTAVRWLPEQMHDVLISLLSEPYVLVLLVGCAYAVGIILWTTVLSLLSKRRYPIAPGQALMLVVWPRWPLLVVMLAAMVIASMDEMAPSAVLYLGAAWVAISLLSVVRALVDFVLVTRVPLYMLAPALLLNPGVVLLGALAIILFPIGPEVGYLWSIATKS